MDIATIRIADTLFDAKGQLHTYAILDGASIPGLLRRLDELRPECLCLYRGDLEPELAEVAPYLVLLRPGLAFADWILQEGWGKHWGIFALSKADLRAMAAHLRKFLIVRDPDGKQLYFRYYDPRVMRVFWPTCDAEQREYIFGPTERYVSEGEWGTAPVVISRV